MNLRNALLGTTAVMGAAALAVPSTASAFDVNINGFMNFNAVMGDNREALGRSASSFDFVTDTEIHIQGVQTDDETGIRYGMTVEFEADAVTSSGNPIDENWIFIDGSFGGIRLGNEDGVIDNSKLGAYTIAAGTGGIDGQGVVGSVKFAPVNSSDSTKARYYSPTFAGFSVGVSYTPNYDDQGNNVARTDNAQSDLDNWVEAGLIYSNSFGGLDLLASVVGGSATGNNGLDDYQGGNIGAVVGLYGFEVAGSYWIEKDAPGGGTSSNRNGFTAGAAASFGPADLSVTYAKVTNGGGGVGEGDNVVLSASMGLLPGMALQGDVSWFDRDVGGDDDGVTGVARVRVAF